jgi:sulfate adenylyltransferase large subunit
MELLRFVTAGNVDDGKSTLIGRLLYDSKAIMEDQLVSVEEASKKRGFDYLNLALLTDGLKAEREQGITIDVAYRYFSTPKRKFMIADCPGHVQYTRNMVTGASTANMAVVLVDARKGIVEQTRRHCFVASLLRIPHLVICVNKMDLVDFSQHVFDKIRDDFSAFSKKLEIYDVTFVPVSALDGDNVVERSTRMSWYRGRSFLEHLQEVHIASDVNCIDFRFPVQSVICPQSSEVRDYRGYAGMVASGGVRKGDEVIALPSGFATRIKAIELGGREIGEATAQMSVVLRLENELDVGRGDMIVRPNNRPTSVQDIEATICWMDQEPLVEDKRYLVRQATAEAIGVIKEVDYKFDIETLSRIVSDKRIALNDMARIRLRVSRPLHVDPYRINRVTGSFVLIDESTCRTVAAGMIL